jgi:nitrite reductase/ring-hydroxylating ferredoxin subunit
MTSASSVGFRPGLVDLDKGLISREIFVDEAIYREEQERVFARAWLFVGHESQIPNPGDFFVSSMGEEAVILCRDRAQKIHVFLNSCRHRGMKVCRYDEGNTPVFTCPYHGWSYASDGRLVGVPYFREAYHSQLDRTQWGLVEVAQLSNYKGAIWATWDKEAPAFAEYLGDFAPYLEQTFDAWDGGDGGIEVLGGIQKWRVPCNWKFPAENFSGDSYHNISHRSVDLVGVGPSGSGRPRTGTRQSFPNISRGARRPVAIGVAIGGASSRLSARCFRLWPFSLGSRARSPSGSRADRTRPRFGAGFSSTRRRRRRSRISCAIITSAIRARPA